MHIARTHSSRTAASSSQSFRSSEASSTGFEGTSYTSGTAASRRKSAKGHTISLCDLSKS